MAREVKNVCELVRIDGKLVELSTIEDEGGNIIHKFMQPVALEVYFRDFVQMMVGATLLAIPVGFAQESWLLGKEMSNGQILGMFIMSIFFIGVFVYYHSYHGKHFKAHIGQYVKRVVATYVLAFAVSALLLMLIGKVDFSADLWLSIKRAIVVAFPASLSAAVTDTIK